MKYFSVGVREWRLAAMGIVLAGCSFDTTNLLLDDDGAATQPDADRFAPDADPIAIDAAVVPDAVPGTPDATPCSFDQDICDTGEPDGPLAINADTVFDTDTDPLCRTLAQVNGPDVCLVVLDGFTLNTGANFIAIGSRPLVIASVGDININSLIYVSSRIGGPTGAGANFEDCAVATSPQGDAGGSGGGAGGSFAGAGGDGGTGDDDTSSGNDDEGDGGTAVLAVSQPAVLRGGCPGGAGAVRNNNPLTAPGNGGGALFLVTPADINLNATSAIVANGAGGSGGDGGDHAGGGGAGSGGHIILEAANINLGGNISANGGGGGEGGTRFSGGNDLDGDDGADGALSSTAANGGAGSTFGGNGGDGSSQLNLGGENGNDSDAAGGGGGGGAGFIIFRGAVQGAGGATSPLFIQE